MKRIARLILCLGLLSVAPALAAPQLGAETIKQSLAGPVISIGHYELDKDGLNEFYAARDYRPAWDLAGAENSSALSGFVASIDKTISYHGLEPTDYALDVMRQLASAGDEDSHLKLEFLVTDTLLRLAHNLHGDNIDLGELYVGWKFHRGEIDIPAVMQKAVAANDVNNVFEQLTPKQTAYRDLAHILEWYNGISLTGGWKPIAAGPGLKSTKDHGPRVLQLRARLAAEGYAIKNPSPGQESVFDDGLSVALKTYQQRNGLDADGHLGPDTLMALNVPLTGRIEQIRSNMERWRHMPEDFPSPRGIIVNIADASVEILDNGKSIYRGIVIVGQVERKTPFIQSVVRSMIVNPSWHVPAKIARADILPKLRKDPHYLEKLGFVIRDNEDDPHGENIDWSNMADEEFNFRLRQQPGAMNSLGRIKFDFNNDYAVYMHGTPHQELFDKNRRTLSSGCVRLRDPEKVAEVVLTGTPGVWDIPHIEAKIASKQTRWIGLAQPIPITILYWTVFTDESGAINFRNDVYDYDRFLMENLRPAAEVPESNDNSDSVHTE